LCEYYELDPFASARCDVSEEASWANEFRLLHAHNDDKTSHAKVPTSRGSQNLAGQRLPSSLTKVNQLVHQTVTALEAEASSLPLDDPQRVQAAQAAQGLRVALSATATTTSDSASATTPHHHSQARPEPWFYDTLREEQNKRWADGRVARGAEHAKEQRMSDAMRCYEQVI